MKVRSLDAQTGARLSIRKVSIAAVLIAVCAACSEDSLTSPATAVDVTGTWQLTYSGRAITIEATLQLTQNGDELEGRFSDLTNFTSVCSGFGGCYSSFEEMAGGTVEGTVSGDRVMLRFQTNRGGEIRAFEGTVRGSEMSGDRWWADRLSGTIPGSTASTQPPAAPSNLRATVLAAEREALLEWTDNSDDEDGFLVAEDCGSGSWSAIGTTDANRTRARITGFPSGARCSYAVAGFKVVSDETLYSDLSNVVVVEMP